MDNILICESLQIDQTLIIRQCAWHTVPTAAIESSSKFTISFKPRLESRPSLQLAGTGLVIGRPFTGAIHEGLFETRGYLERAKVIVGTVNGNR